MTAAVSAEEDLNNVERTFQEHQQQLQQQQRQRLEWNSSRDATSTCSGGDLTGSETMTRSLYKTRFFLMTRS